MQQRKGFFSKGFIRVSLLLFGVMIISTATLFAVSSENLTTDTVGAYESGNQDETQLNFQELLAVTVLSLGLNAQDSSLGAILAAATVLMVATVLLQRPVRITVKR